MARKRVIVGVGEALLAEEDDRESPAGLAILVPIYAVLLGHEGIAISRLGQDASGATLLARLRALGCNVGHLQADPDLATGRARRDARGGLVLVEDHAAYDNLQWDSDLMDVAQRADAVVYGGFTRRSGQARSTTDRFLAECRHALRVFDLSARGDGPDRNAALSGLTCAEVVVVDDGALARILPGSAGRPPRQAAMDLYRLRALRHVVLATEGRALEVHADGDWVSGRAPHDPRTHEAALVGLLHGMLAAWSAADSIALAERLAAHSREHPTEPMPLK